MPLKQTVYKVDSISKLNFVDYLFLRELQQRTFNEEQFFSRGKNISDLGFIIKISNASKYFDNICQQEQYKPLWNELYSTFGLYLSSSATKQVAFYVHESANVNVFELLKGTYLFYLSQQVKEEAGKEFTDTETRLLKSAIAFKSIHATQRYNQYLYSKIDKGTLKADENEKLLLIEAINNCKNMLELYGSYAYMMLAEAYFQYAKWANAENPEKVNSIINAALKACDMAQVHLVKSKHSIHNASLGEGLQCSNSFQIDSPVAAKSILREWLEQTLSPSVNKPS